MGAEADSLHVAVVRLDSVPLSADLDWLHASEHQRLAGLKAAGRRAQFLAGHWLARRLLASVYGGEPGAWQLQERRDLAPEVIAPAHSEAVCSAPIALGLAHSGDWLAAAVGRHRFGIDLEQRGRILPRAAFAPLLINDDETPECVDDEALLLRWVLKEAWVKRDQGSALPDRLRQLALQPDSAGAISAFRNAHLLLAVASPCPARIAAFPDLPPIGRWRVRDAAG